MDKISKAFAENIALDAKRQNIEKILDEAKFDIDLRYFVLINGVLKDVLLLSRFKYSVSSNSST